MDAGSIPAISITYIFKEKEVEESKMKCSGFYMLSAECSHQAKLQALELFEEIKLHLQELDKDVSFSIVEALLYSSYSFSQRAADREYDVHFILHMPNSNMTEDTAEFWALEDLMISGLSIIDED